VPQSRRSSSVKSSSREIEVLQTEPARSSRHLRQNKSLPRGDVHPRTRSGAISEADQLFEDFENITDPPDLTNLNAAKVSFSSRIMGKFSTTSRSMAYQRDAPPLKQDVQRKMAALMNQNKDAIGQLRETSKWSPVHQVNSENLRNDILQKE